LKIFEVARHVVPVARHDAMTDHTNPPTGGYISVVSLLRRRAAESPDRLAYAFLADGETERGRVTYSQLDLQARAFAATMQSLGLAGEPALLLYPPGLDYVTALFGCFYAGVVAVPAYPPRRNRSLERLRTVIADARVAAVLTSPVINPAVDDLVAEIPGLRAIPRLLSDQYAVATADSWHDPKLCGDSLALLQYTSGSTATPKGVMLTHGNLLHNCHWIRRRFGQTSDSSGLVWLPPYHDMGLIGGILEPLYMGGPCYLMAPVTFFGSPFAWLQAISRYRATTSGGPNFAYDLCARKVTAEQRATLDLSCWDLAFCGAEPIRAETIERFAATFAPCGFRKEAFYPCYGLAEATLLAAGGRKGVAPRTLIIQKTALEANQVLPCHPEADGARTVIGCGRTLDDQLVTIVHPEKLTHCAPGEVGEIWVCGPSVAKGYWGRPEETSQTFGAYIAETGEGPYLRTGDLGFVHNAQLYITGRLKDLIILRGRNLYPQDLERSAERSHSDLQPCGSAAFAVDEDGYERLVIAAELMPRRRPDLDIVAEAVRRAVADEHEAELYAFVLLNPGGLPKTSSGKVQRRACRQAFLTVALDAFGHWRAGRHPSAGGLTRAAILALPERRQHDRLTTYFRTQLARLLRLDPADIDPRQPVNTFGLDSLMTLELKNSLEERLGVTLPVSTFLQGRSIAQLVSEVLRELSLPAAVPVPRGVGSILREIQDLTDDQVKTQLATERVAG